MVPEDLTRIQFVTDPQLSPDGRRVAFVVTTLSEERDEYLSNIWVVDVAGGVPRRFTAGPRRDLEPRWSPDGSRLAFLSERTAKDKLQLYVMPADGGEPTKLTALDNGVSAIAWAPDGARLALVSAVGGYKEPEGEVPIQRRRVHLRPAAARLRRLARRRELHPDHRGRFHRRRPDLVARR
jgi:dipeptidyl aminopeptidase/acylaminoacyl peptidase